MTPQLPPWSEPMFDDQGRMTVLWRAFFEAAVAQLQDHEDRIQVLEP